jgi:SNF2 family DNA or RNA helicase
MCPAPNCSKTLSLESLFSSGALRICISSKSSSAGASSSADNESSAISQSSYISSKIQAAIDILNNIINTDALTESDTMESNRSRVAPVKAIVFSQWTGMLDLLELQLNTNLIQYRRLDGTMSLNLRDKAVKDFNTDPEVVLFCFLPSCLNSFTFADISVNICTEKDISLLFSPGQGYDYVTESR